MHTDAHQPDAPTDRKRFLKLVGGSGAAAALGLVLAACGDDDEKSNGGATSKAAPATTATTPAGVKGDLEILNYALTLEYLEADFYRQAIDSGEIKDKAVVEIAKKFGDTEQQHVDALTATIKKLGGKPVMAPTTAFEEVLAGGPDKILSTAAIVENLGAAAYLGQAGAIEDKDVLAAALGIHSVEARHAAALNHLIGAGFKGDGALSGSLPDGAFAKSMTMDEVLAAAKPFIKS